MKKTVCIAIAFLLLFVFVNASAEAEYPTEKVSKRDPLNIFTFLSSYDMFAEEMFYCDPHVPEPQLHGTKNGYAIYYNKNLDIVVKFLTGDGDGCMVRSVIINVDKNPNYKDQIMCAVCAIASYNGYDGSASQSQFKKDVENWWYHIERATMSDRYYLYGMSISYYEGHIGIVLE